MLHMPNHCLSSICIQEYSRNGWNSDVICGNNVFLCSIHKAITGSFIIPLAPSQDTRKIMIFMLPRAFLRGDVDGRAALGGWQLSTSILLCTDQGGAEYWGMKGSLRVWGMNSWTKSVCQNVHLQTRNVRLLCTFFEGRLYTEVVNSFTSVYYW